MKTTIKFFSIGLACLMLFGVSSCKNKKEVVPIDVPAVTLNVEHSIATDREDMFLNYNEDYKWFETCVLLKDYLDSDSTTSAVAGITSIFQTITEKNEGFDTHVIMFVHTEQSNGVEIKDGFWVEDFPLNDAEISVTFEEAYNRLMEANLPKPHSKHCVLRKELGPKAANPQYIFGNNQYQVYVDAATGEVTDVNPVFEGTGFEKPLGEWP